MNRAALLVVLFLVAFPAAAGAKGPHASLSGEAPRPGEPWTAKLQLFEFGPDAAAPPLVVARRADERVSFLVQELSRYTPPQPDVLTELRYRLHGAFPSAGRWVITVTTADAGTEPFRFELQVGGVGATPVRDQVAVPGRAAAHGTPLPPQVFEPPAEGAGNEEAALRAWIPAAAVVLAAAGAAAMLQRRRRTSPG